MADRVATPRWVRIWRAIFTTVYIVVTLPFLVLGANWHDMDWHAGNGPAWWKWIRMEKRWP